MSETGPPNERLELIRNLIERSPIYRAISAYSALVTGLLSLLAAVGVYLNSERLVILGRDIQPREFVTLWFLVLVCAWDATALFLWREARRQGRPFLSAEYKLALGNMVPCLLLPAAYTIWFYRTGYLGARELELVVIWIAFYGLALLSTSLFAPRSILRLGWAFLLTALSVPALLSLFEPDLPGGVPNFLMGLTFGLYHLIYAAVTWPRKR